VPSPTSSKDCKPKPEASPPPPSEWPASEPKSPRSCQVSRVDPFSPFLFPFSRPLFRLLRSISPTVRSILGTRLLRVLLLLFLVGEVNAKTMRDGVNILTATEKHTDITLAGGANAELGRWLEPDEYTMVIRSVSNWNDQFLIEFRPKVPLHGSGTAFPCPGVLVDGRLIIDLASGWNKTIDSTMAKRIATICHAELVYRKHLDHELAIRFETDKPDYKVGSPIAISVLAKNVGAKSVFLRPESLIAKERSVLLDIVPAPGLLPHQPLDVRDPHDMVSWGESIVEVKPGEVVKMRQEDFGKWYQCKEEGLYSFIGMYEIDLFDSLKATHPAWVEWLGDTFSISIRQ